MKRVVLALALVAAAVLTRPPNVATQTNLAQVGQWSTVQTWPAIGVHAHLLNSGKVLGWEEGSQATLRDPAARVVAAGPARAGRRPARPPAEFGQGPGVGRGLAGHPLGSGDAGVHAGAGAVGGPA